MEWMGPNFFSALLAIIVIDLVLAGDNAIVIALSARRLPKEQQRKVILWGTVGAVGIRTVLTLGAVYLLKVPGLMGLGGLLLVWIAYRLLAAEKSHHVKEAASFAEALRTVWIADTVMALDNVLAVAGAAHGNLLLVVLGLLISVPIVVWGSTLILRLVERVPAIIYAGAGVLAWTAAKMITDERLLQPVFASMPILVTIMKILIIAGVLATGWATHQYKRRLPAA